MGFRYWSDIATGAIYYFYFILTKILILGKDKVQINKVNNFMFSCVTLYFYLIFSFSFVWNKLRIFNFYLFAQNTKLLIKSNNLWQIRILLHKTNEILMLFDSYNICKIKKQRINLIIFLNLTLTIYNYIFFASRDLNIDTVNILPVSITRYEI